MCNSSRSWCLFWAWTEATVEHSYMFININAPGFYRNETQRDRTFHWTIFLFIKGTHTHTCSVYGPKSGWVGNSVSEHYLLGWSPSKYCDGDVHIQIKVFRSDSHSHPHARSLTTHNTHTHTNAHEYFQDTNSIRSDLTASRNYGLVLSINIDLRSHWAWFFPYPHHTSHIFVCMSVCARIRFISLASISVLTLKTLAIQIR